MIQNSNRARLSSFLSERSLHAYPGVCVCVRARVRVGACRGTWMTGCQWKGCDYLAAVCASCVQGQGHSTSSLLTLCGQETLLYDFPTRGKHSRHSRARWHPISLWLFHHILTKKKCRIHNNNIKSTHLWTVYLVLFFYRSYFLSSSICFVQKALKRGPSLPLPVLTLWLLLCNNNVQVLVQCPAVDLRVCW